MASEPDLVQAILLVHTGHATTDDPGQLHRARSLYNAVRRARTDTDAAKMLHNGTCTYAAMASDTSPADPRAAYWMGVRDTVCGPGGAKHIEWILAQEPFVKCRNEGRS